MHFYIEQGKYVTAHFSNFREHIADLLSVANIINTNYNIFLSTYAFQAKNNKT